MDSKDIGKLALHRASTTVGYFQVRICLFASLHHLFVGCKNVAVICFWCSKVDRLRWHRSFSSPTSS